MIKISPKVVEGKEESECNNTKDVKYVYTKAPPLLSRIFKSLNLRSKEANPSYMNSIAQVNLDSKHPLVFTEKDIVTKGCLLKLSVKKGGRSYSSGKPAYYILRSDTNTLCHYRRSYDLVLISESKKLDTGHVLLDGSCAKYPYTMVIRRVENTKMVSRFKAVDKQTFDKWVLGFESVMGVKMVKEEVLEEDGSMGELSGRVNSVKSEDTNEEEDNNQSCERSDDEDIPQVGEDKHSFKAGGQTFELDTKYSFIKSIGSGAYGAVISVKNEQSKQQVAVKKISNIFDDLVDAKRILREIRLLGHFDHKNVTKLLDLPPPSIPRHFDDMYIVTDLMETDLHQVIYSMQQMSDDHIKYFLYQLLCGLYHIHSAGVLHRDIKPSNILLNANCDLKICDFGLARGGWQSADELTEYVVTRWYRAPEIMLNCLSYNESVDMWAVGCILAELLQREPLLPGKDYIHQLKLIVRFLGTPRQEDITFVKNAKALRFLSRLPISIGIKLDHAFPEANTEALDLLQKMLVFNPAKRISVIDALKHPYLASFYDPNDITKASTIDFSFDIPDDDLTKDDLIDLLYSDVRQFHPNTSIA